MTQQKNNNNNNKTTTLKRWNDEQLRLSSKSIFSLMHSGLSIKTLHDDDTTTLTKKGYKLNKFIRSSLQGNVYIGNNYKMNEYVIKTCNKELSSTFKGLVIDKNENKTETIKMVGVNENILREIAIMTKLKEKKNHSCVFSCIYLDMFNMFMCASDRTMFFYVYIILFLYLLYTLYTMFVYVIYKIHE